MGGMNLSLLTPKDLHALIASAERCGWTGLAASTSES